MKNKKPQLRFCQTFVEILLNTRKLLENIGGSLISN